MRTPEWPDFRAGKAAFLRGDPLDPPQWDRQRLCDWRKGWLSARAERKAHPDWGERYILSHDGEGLMCWQ